MNRKFCQSNHLDFEVLGQLTNEGQLLLFLIDHIHNPSFHPITLKLTRFAALIYQPRAKRLLKEYKNVL